MYLARQGGGLRLRVLRCMDVGRRTYTLLTCHSAARVGSGGTGAPMGRSADRRRAVRLAASLADLADCLRSELAADTEGRVRPPLQATGGRARYVTLRPPRPKPPAGADEAGGASAARGAGPLPAAPQDVLAGLAARQKEPRVGPNYQATRLPPCRPGGCVPAGAVQRRVPSHALPR